MTGNEKLCKIYFRKLFFQKGLAFFEVPNSRVTKSSYETELRKMTSHFELLIRSRKIKSFTSSY